MKKGTRMRKTLRARAQTSTRVVLCGTRCKSVKSVGAIGGGCVVKGGVMVLVLVCVCVSVGCLGSWVSGI